MPDEGQQQSLFSSQDILPTIILGMLTKDPLAYPRFKMGAQRAKLEDLFRSAQIRKWKQEEEEGNKPASVPVYKEREMPSGGIQLESGEIPEYDVPTETKKQMGFEDIPVPGYRVKDLRSLAGTRGLAGLYSAMGLSKKEPKAMYARNKENKIVTYREGEVPPEGFWPIEHEPKAAPAPKMPLHRDTYDQRSGLTSRQEYEDDGVTPKGKPYQIKGPAPEKPSEREGRKEKEETKREKALTRLSSIATARANLAAKGITPEALEGITDPGMQALYSSLMGQKLSADGLAKVNQSLDEEEGYIREKYKFPKKSLAKKATESGKIQEQIDKFSGLPVPGAKAEQMKTQKASVFRKKDGSIYARMLVGTEIPGELKEGKFIPKR